MNDHTLNLASSLGLYHQMVTCKIHGPYMGFRYYDAGSPDGYSQWSECPRCQEEHPRKDIITYDAKAETRRRRERFAEEALIPAEYQPCTFKTFVVQHDTHVAAIQACKDLLDGQLKKVLLYGPTGVGKSHLAVATIYEAIEHDMTARYTTEYGLISEVMMASDEGYGSDRKMLRLFGEFDLLVIDEIGKGRLNSHEMNILFAVIDSRHSAKKRTMYVGNLGGKADYIEHFTDPMRSRISQNGKSFRIVGEDWRIKKEQHA